MSILPRLFYVVSASPMKIQVAFFIEIEKKNPKIHMKPQRPSVARAVLSKKNKLEPSHFLISKYITKLQESKLNGSGM